MEYRCSLRSTFGDRFLPSPPRPLVLAIFSNIFLFLEFPVRGAAQGIIPVQLRHCFRLASVVRGKLD